MKKICLLASGFILLAGSVVYAAFPYSMTFTPSTGNTILADHINTSNNEHINNNIPESIDDLSVDVAEMGSTKDPFVGDSEVQAVTLGEELQELRHAVDQIKKKFNTSATKWYHDTTDEGVLWIAGADVASGTSTPFLIDGRRVDVTGTTTITSFATVGIGTVKTVEFTGALTLTHDATNLRLPFGLNITTAAGDIGVFHEYAAGDWELVSYSRAISNVVIRAMTLRLQPGATPGTNINVTVLAIGVDPASTTNATDLADSGTSGSFSLNAGPGSVLTMDLAETITGVLSSGVTLHDLNNSSTTAGDIWVPFIQESGGNLLLSLRKVGAGSEADLTGILQAGDICDIIVTFITST